jgi:hypothetical protein
MEQGRDDHGRGSPQGWDLIDDIANKVDASPSCLYPPKKLLSARSGDTFNLSDEGRIYEKTPRQLVNRSRLGAGL